MTAQRPNRFAGTPLSLDDVLQALDGDMAWWGVKAPAEEVKTLLCRLEDALPIGRLWDLDVLGEDGRPLSRQALGLPPRACLVCDAPAKICARERRHDLSALQAAIQQRWQWQSHALDMARAMREALCQEALLTPKPGLVDALNHDNHPDMPLPLMLQSAATLEPYFAAMAMLGMQYPHAPDTGLLARLRPLGLAAEQATRRTTGGVNTHKGAIFAFGLWAAVLGWQYRLGQMPQLSDTAGHIAQRYSAAMRWAIIVRAPLGWCFPPLPSAPPLSPPA